jgi:uncharacterized protein YkwD
MLQASLKQRYRLLAVMAALACAVSLADGTDARAARACQSANATPARADSNKLVGATLCLVNAARSARGLAPLRHERRLAKAAQRHAVDMAHKRYFAHDSLDGSTFLDRIRAAGYLRESRSWTAGENIAWGSGSRSTPRSIVRAWMASEGHRANILSAAFRDIGIGVTPGAPMVGVGRPAAIYATDFGARG